MAVWQRQFSVGLSHSRKLQLLSVTEQSCSRSGCKLCRCVALIHGLKSSTWQLGLSFLKIENTVSRFNRNTHVSHTFRLYSLHYCSPGVALNALKIKHDFTWCVISYFTWQVYHVLFFFNPVTHIIYVLLRDSCRHCWDNSLQNRDTFTLRSGYAPADKHKV